MSEGRRDWVIVANVIEDPLLRRGAKVYLIQWHGSADNVQVIGLSRGGRRITKYIPFKRLRNFRPGWAPPYVDSYFDYDEKEKAGEVARQLR